MTIVDRSDSQGYDDRGIFLVGCPRSGTTLLRMIMDSHPELCAGEETGFLREMQNLTLHRWPHLKFFGLSKKEVLNNIRHLFLAFHHRFCAVTGKHGWVDKSPTYVKDLRFIDELFPKSKVLHIIRDGRDIAASYREKWDRRGFIKALYEWIECVKKGREAREWLGEDRYFEIRYEELVNNQRKVLMDVTDFLEIEWDEALMNHSSVHHVSTKFFGYDRPTQPITQSKVSTWRNRLCWYEKLLVTLAFRNLLRQLQYVKCGDVDSSIWIFFEKLISRAARTMDDVFSFLIR